MFMFQCVSHCNHSQSPPQQAFLTLAPSPINHASDLGVNSAVTILFLAGMILLRWLYFINYCFIHFSLIIHLFFMSRACRLSLCYEFLVVQFIPSANVPSLFCLAVEYTFTLLYCEGFFSIMYWLTIIHTLSFYRFCQ